MFESNVRRSVRSSCLSVSDRFHVRLLATNTRYQYSNTHTLASLFALVSVRVYARFEISSERISAQNGR